ncbi:MAG: hypothetical protein A2X08_17980 [Bacteroidetes bacterium GWA2_32_17]|nr:MAG: hypothetical protein A2X08_17980 [Bacteroidetes bacterium GWA2_32_17]
MKAKVLVVDDNPENIQVISTCLSNEGYEVEFTLNGTDAINWVSQTNFDLVLLDVMMPEIDGFEVCRKIKQLPRTVDLPIIFLTAKTDIESITTGFNEGGVDYISKPFNSLELLSRVKTHVEIRKNKLKLNQLYGKLKQYNEEINDSITYAKYIQDGLIPSEAQFQRIFPDSFLINKPKNIVSGDFLWVKQTDNKVYLAMVDCSGHGVPGAMLSILGISLLDHIFNENKDLSPSDYLQLLQSNLKNISFQSPNKWNESMDVSFCVLDRINNSFEYSGANLPVIIISDKAIIHKNVISQSFNEMKHSLNIVKCNKASINLNSEDIKFDDFKIKLNKKDNIYLFSDGFFSQLGGKKSKKYSRSQLHSDLQEIHQAPFSEKKEIMNSKLMSWIGNSNEQTDDITIFGFSI